MWWINSIIKNTLSILLDCMYITRWYMVPTISSYSQFLFRTPAQVSLCVLNGQTGRQNNIMLPVSVLPPTPFRETALLAFGVDTEAELSLQVRIEPRHTNSVRMDVHCSCLKPTWSSKTPSPQQQKQDRQCTYNVTSRRARATIITVEKQWVLHSMSVCICSLRYPARKAHAPCNLWPTPLYYIFPHYLTNGTIFEKKKILNIKGVFRVSLQLLSETFLILRRSEPDMIKNA